MRLLILLLSIIVLIETQICHYSCSTCLTSDYYQCTVCQPNRGNNLKPINGMCYCSNDADEDENGICQASGSYNSTSKALIIAFITMTLILSVFAVFVKGMKYFLYKTIEDVQELSLIVFINLYFPQQFDMFLGILYRFNISSYTFQNIAMGSLFEVMPDSTVVTKDAQNIYGKYKLLVKTANFFGNQFTWILVFFSIFVFAIIVRFVRNWLKKKQDFEIIRKQLKGSPEKQNIHEQSHENVQEVQRHEFFQITRVNNDEGKINLYWFVNKLYNILWFNFLIVFFYFSIIEININIFTQIANLTFSSNFATVGAFFSAIFLATQITLLTLLFLKAKEEMIKPEWMRDYSFTPTIYLIRTNFKTLTKYFWFFSCLKKILLALMLTVFYDNPLSAIVGVSAVHATYLSLAIYCQPFERKYIRVHFYLTESMKMFMFLSLVDFTTKYAYSVQLINLTIIIYSLLVFIFGTHFIFLLINLIVERSVYQHFLLKKFCTEKYPQLQQERIGYRSNDKVYIYVKQ